MCEECEVPLCKHCFKAVAGERAPRMPERALSNDMMTFYAPKVLYEKKVTIMEMICASVCLTTMIAFTLERKHRKTQPRMFDQEVHMQRHTVGARGNATSFPMPWQEILDELKNIDDQATAGNVPDLPRNGEELVNWVQVLLKTSGANTYGKKSCGGGLSSVRGRLLRQPGWRSQFPCDTKLVSLPGGGWPPRAKSWYC